VVFFRGSFQKNVKLLLEDLELVLQLETIEKYDVSIRLKV